MFKAIIAAMCECSMIFLFFFDFIFVLFQYGGKVWLVGGGKGDRMDDQVRERLNESSRLVLQKKENSRRKEEDRTRKLRNEIDISRKDSLLQLQTRLPTSLHIKTSLPFILAPKIKCMMAYGKPDWYHPI